ncbi:MAG: NPCBM/NEW2 domain-containing protein [Phycisphaerae bacterium]|nr:NPCBM/NEW2 domain-containing protein [Phycisphaerae bacterium]
MRSDRIGILATALVASLGPTPALAAWDGTVRIVAVNTGPGSGKLQSFALAEGLVIEGREARAIRIASPDLIQIETGLPYEKPASETIAWSLTNGDLVLARVVRGNERAVTLARIDVGEFDVPLTHIRAVHARPEEAALDAMTTTRPASRDDVLHLTNGDRLTGLVSRIDARGVAIETDTGETVVSLTVLRSAGLAQLGRPATRPSNERRLQARLTLRDGSRLTTDKVGWRSGQLLVPIERDGKPVDAALSMDRVRRIEILGGRWQWLGELTPLVAEHTPLLGVPRPHQIDRNVLDGMLRIGKQTFERGIGVHSRSRLVYALDDDCRRFICAYGLDEDSGPMADVDVKVLLDGKVKHHAPTVRADGQLRKISLDVQGAKRLELLVDFGKNGNVQDRLDWVSPAIIRR